MKIVNYVLVFIAVTTIGMLYDRYNRKFYVDEELDKYSLVKKYLLNESDSITGKPFIWIHTKHNINARDWLSFKSRNSKRLNQPYKDLCVETIIKNCGNHFRICLIDDNSFEKIIPNWTINLNGLSNPVKQKVRSLAISKLLYTYGGLSLPNSSIVFKNLNTLYNNNLSNGMFVGEFVNRGNSSVYERFFPNNKLIGCIKNNNNMKEYIEYLEILISQDNTDDSKFQGKSDRFLYGLIQNNKCKLIDGKVLGTKTSDNKAVLIDNLLKKTSINFCKKSLNMIILPDNEILNRTKYQWFNRLNHAQVFKANTEASKYLLIAHNK